MNIACMKLGEILLFDERIRRIYYNENYNY